MDSALAHNKLHLGLEKIRVAGRDSQLLQEFLRVVLE